VRNKRIDHQWLKKHSPRYLSLETPSVLFKKKILYLYTVCFYLFYDGDGEGNFGRYTPLGRVEQGVGTDF